MAKVIDEQKFYSPEGYTYVHLSIDDKNGYGVDVSAEQGVGGAMVGIDSFEFGNDEQLAMEWFEYVCYIISNKPWEEYEHIISPLQHDDIDKIKEILNK